MVVVVHDVVVAVKAAAAKEAVVKTAAEAVALKVSVVAGAGVS